MAVTERDPRVLSVTEASAAGEARRAATTMAGRIGMDDTARGTVALIVSEAANNLARHAQHGELILRSLEWQGIAGIEMLALDRGPGIRNLRECLRDGFSTAGTSGTGLGAITRLATFWDIHSAPEIGTALLVRFWATGERPTEARVATPPPAPSLEWGVVNLPLASEEWCGDSYAVEHLDGRTLLLVVDGLGHGVTAADAAREAVKVFRNRRASAPAEIIQALHEGLRGTRGAVAAVAAVDHSRRQVRYAGAGNISASVLTPGASQNMVSHNGTLGHEVRKVQEFTYDWPRGATLVMHSDGLSSQWRPDKYAGLLARHPSLIAGILYRDFKRTRDDVTVLVAQEPAC